MNATICHTRKHWNPPAEYHPQSKRDCSVLAGLLFAVWPLVVAALIVGYLCAR